MREISELLDRLKKAPRGSVELDAAVARALGAEARVVGKVGYKMRNVPWISHDTSRWLSLPRFTRSLDDACDLIPADLYWIAGFGKRSETEPLGACGLYRPGKDDPIAEAEAATVALAVCSAVLRLRAASL